MTDLETPILHDNPDHGSATPPRGHSTRRRRLTDRPRTHRIRYIKLRFQIALFRAVARPPQWFEFISQKFQKTDGGTLCEIQEVPSREPGRGMKVYVYCSATRHEGCKAEEKATRPVPVVINFHGSGFCLPSLGTDREFCSLLAAHTGFHVLDADYRKAPEFPFPAALEDMEDIISFVRAHPERYDAANIFLCGFSAGGCIALAVAASNESLVDGTGGKERPPPIKGVLAFYPSVDLTKRHRAHTPAQLYREHAHLHQQKSTVDIRQGCGEVEGEGDETYTPPAVRTKERKGKGHAGLNIPHWLRELFYNCYLPPGIDRTDPRVSPCFALAAPLASALAPPLRSRPSRSPTVDALDGPGCQDAPAPAPTDPFPPWVYVAIGELDDLCPPCEVFVQRLQHLRSTPISSSSSSKRASHLSTASTNADDSRIEHRGDTVLDISTDPTADGDPKGGAVELLLLPHEKHAFDKSGKNGSRAEASRRRAYDGAIAMVLRASGTQPVRRVDGGS